jgi:Tfp pilus assembly protein PilX
MKRQYGFAHFSLVLLLLVIVIVGLAGYKVAKNHSTVVNSAATTSTQNIQTIKSKADLNSAESTLNNENVDSDLNPDSLNQDVNSLL